jgi:hypothetical protein
MTEPEVLVVDHSTDKIKEWRYATDGEVSIADQQREYPLPEGLMAQLEQHLGDANAQVVVSSDMATSDYGNKAGSFVSIKVTCNNSEEDILAVHGIAREMTEELVQENYHRMAAIFESAKNGPAKSAVPSKAQGQVQGQAKPGRIKLGAPKTTKSPDFRR